MAVPAEPILTLHFISLFPEVIEACVKHSILARAQESGLVKFRFHSLREHGIGKWKSVDDSPYGGGEGMVLRADVLSAALEKVKSEIPSGEAIPQFTKTLLMSPQGVRLNSENAKRYAKSKHLVIVAGHYEGLDERFIEAHVDEESSIGDFVCTGGEIPSALLADAVVRWIPGVLGNSNSASNDSFENSLLKYPQFTRPPEFEGKKVPEVLLSGDHSKIAAWRKNESVSRTQKKRPDLISKNTDRALKTVAPLYVVLLHDPVQNRKGEKVISSVTNLDLHDISRSSRTYGAVKYFVVTPLLDQKELVSRILGHWKEERARLQHPDRFEALSLIEVESSFEDVKKKIELETGARPEVVFTDARPHARAKSYREYRNELEDPRRGKRPVCLLLGTAWGILPEWADAADVVLAPILGPEGPDGYNHLSVRAAAAVILDRLFGN